MQTFSQHLTKYLTQADIDALLNALDDHPMDALYLNEAKMDKATFLSLFPLVKPHPIVKEGFLYDKSIYPLGKSYLFDAGIYYLQEPSAMIVASLLDYAPFDRVLDLCAAPGGKTTQASLKLGEKGIVFANDLAYPRAKILSSNVERMGLVNVVVTSQDYQTIAPRFSNYFDKIILDAPCSGSGMFRKLDTMKEDWSYNKVIKCAETQKALIHLAYSMLAPGGKMVYSTCSYSYEENEEVIFDLLKDTDATVLPIEDHPMYYHHHSLKEAIHLFSHLFPGEGHFICLLQKPGNPKIKEPRPLPELHLDPFMYFGHLRKKDDSIEALPEMIDTQGLTVLRYGVNLGELSHGRYEPSHHASHVIKTERVIALSEDEKKRYLHGETLQIKPVLSGYYLVAYQGLPLGWGKAVQGVLKNHYPKGLRH